MQAVVFNGSGATGAGPFATRPFDIPTCGQLQESHSREVDRERSGLNRREGNHELRLGE